MLGTWLFAEGFARRADDDLSDAVVSGGDPRHRRRFRAFAVRHRQALALFVLPILQARLGTDMFWVVAISAATPIVFLLIVRYEPTARDIDDDGGV